jgi:hypothetical protein
MKLKNLLLLFAITLIAIPLSCSKDDFQENNGVCPKVTISNPTNNAVGVSLNQVITVTFNEKMNPSSINQDSFIIEAGASEINGVISASGTTATFTPNVNLTPNSSYKGKIKTTVKDVNGNFLQEDYVWTFTTGAIILPSVILTDPLDNAENVAINKIITAKFDMDMNPLTINEATFIVTEGLNTVPGVVNYSNLIASFIPTAPLLLNTNYSVIINTGAQNTAGLSIGSDFTWHFKTQNSTLAPELGAAAQFGAFGGNAGITNQGIFTIINGSIGTTAAATLITGFHDNTATYTETTLNVGHVTDAIYTAPPFPGTATSLAIASQGLIDANSAYISISPASLPGGIDPGAGELGGLTLLPGIYKSDSGTFNISNGNLTLDAQGDSNATWIFQTAAGLTVGIAGPSGAKSVILTNGALSKNVFWYVGSAATINGAGGGTMVGTIIANSGVTFSTAGNVIQTLLNGRAISLIASVTMVNTIINIPQ